MSPNPELTRLPYPVALTAQRLEDGLASDEDVVKTLLRLKDCFEASIKYLGSVVLVDYFHSPAVQSARTEALLQKMIRPSLGVWVSTIVGDVSRWLVANLDDSQIPPVARLFISPGQGQGANPKSTELFQQAEAFVAYRNDALGHGALRSDATYRQDLSRWQPLLRQLLDAVASLAPWQLCLVTDPDQCQSWMGPLPSASRESVPFLREQVGHFVLIRPVERLRVEVKDLHPFVCLLPDNGQTHRLHYYDFLHRYQETRKEAAMLEYDEGFKRAFPDPLPGLEDVFTRELLAQTFKRHQSAMREIDGRVANFSELLAQHAHIVGRAFALERVQKFVAENDRGLLVIEAEPGKGKTALLAHLIEETFGHYAPPPVHFFYRRTAGIQNPNVCVRSLYGALLEAHNLTEAEESRAQQDADAVFTKLTNLLSHEIAPRLLPSRPQLIFIDALDEAGSGSMGSTAFQRVPENIPAGVYFIVTTRPVKERASLARRDNLHWLNLDALEFREYNLWDSQLYVITKMADAGLGPDTLAEIARLGAGNFLVLTLLCRHLRTGLRSSEVADFLHRLATNGAKDMLGFIYEEFWERLAERCTSADMNVLCDVAGLFATAQAPVTADILCECLELRAGDWDFALRRLGEYLAIMDEEQADARQVFYRIYHETFADFLRGKFHTHEHRFNELLGNYALGWAARDDGYERTFSLRFAPTHLIAARRWDDLEKLLTDLTFLEAKNEAGLVFDLATDFTNTVNAVPAGRPQRHILELLGEALRREIHFIARHAKDYPQALFQVLWNNCWWYDCPEVVPHYKEAKGEWVQPALKLCTLMENWRTQKETVQPGFYWVCSKGLPLQPLGGGQRTVLRAHEGPIESVCFSPDGSTLASGSWDNTVRVWDSASGRERAILRGHDLTVTSVCFSPDGVLSPADRMTKRCGCGTPPTGRNGPSCADMKAWFRASVSRRMGACSPAGRQTKRCGSGTPLAARNGPSCADMKAGLRAFVSRRMGAPSPVGRQTKRCGSGTPPAARNGPYCADMKTEFRASVSCRTRTPLSAGLMIVPMRVWDAASGQEQAVVRGHIHRVSSVCCSPDGSTLASGSWDKTVRVWDAASGREQAVLRAHESPVWSVCFSPDSRTLASGSWDHTVRIWDAASRQEQAILHGHQSGVKSVCASLDGRILASGSSDKTVRVWDAASGQERRVLRGHQGSVSSICFSPEGCTFRQRIV